MIENFKQKRSESHAVVVYLVGGEGYTGASIIYVKQLTQPGICIYLILF